MGCPLSRFHQLNDLIDKKYDAPRKFAEFKLTAIILHDPKDREFKQSLIENFQQYDEKTGKNFLFITFIEPPRLLLDQNRSYMQHERLNLTAESGMDDEQALYRLKQRFRLQYQRLPIFLITDDLVGKNFVVVQTSKEQLRSQLTEIGSFCDALEHRIPLDDERVQKLIANIGGGTPVELLDVPITEVLLDVIATHKTGIGLQGEFRDFIERAFAQEDQTQCVQRVEESLRRANDKLKSLKDSAAQVSDLGSDDYEAHYSYQQEYDDAVEEIIACTIAKGRGQHRDERPRSEKRYRRERYDSREEFFSMMTEFVMDTDLSHKVVQPIANSYRLDRQSLRGCEDDTDSQCELFNELIEYIAPLSEIDPQSPKWGLLCHPLGLMMETEINFSIVQMMRKVKGISIPPFFCKVDRNRGKVEIAGVPLNRYRADIPSEWEFVPLGKAKYAYVFMADNFINNKDFNDLGPEFRSLLGEISFLRDGAFHAHVSPFEKDDFFRAHCAFKRITNKYFKQLMEIKKELRMAQ